MKQQLHRYLPLLVFLSVCLTSHAQSNKLDKEESSIENLQGEQFFKRADSLMTAMIQTMLISPRKGVWNTSYPNATGPYWEGDATVWGQGAAFSGFVALREVSLHVPGFEEKYSSKDDLFYDGLNHFLTKENGYWGYACYPAQGNERLLDDNVWIGLDMIDLYHQTKNKRYLEKAETIWKLLMTGNDKALGGGVYWYDYPLKKRTSKHTCSTAPVAVMAAKMYLLTKKKKYLNKSIELYDWLKKNLQDPEDHLFWDLMNEEGKIDKAKYSYNTGQPMETACLLYQITRKKEYLQEAQQMAEAAFAKWFDNYYFPQLRKEIKVAKGNTWFNAILLRGYLALYRIDGNNQYIQAYEDMFNNVWMAPEGMDQTGLLNYNDFKGLKPQKSWEVIHIGACVEMMARLAMNRLE